MRTCVPLLFMLAATQVAAGPAWRWVDANGTVHYSDRPVPGAQEVFLPESAPARAAANAPAQASNSPATPAVQTAVAAEETDAEAFQAYRRLAIVSPAAEETLWSLGGQLTVTLDIVPELQRGHTLKLYYDGQAVGVGNDSGTRVTVNDVFRGAHTVQAEIVDAQDMPLMRSSTVQFYVQQTSIQNPNR